MPIFYDHNILCSICGDEFRMKSMYPIFSYRSICDACDSELGSTLNDLVKYYEDNNIQFGLFHRWFKLSILEELAYNKYRHNKRKEKRETQAEQRRQEALSKLERK